VALDARAAGQRELAFREDHRPGSGRDPRAGVRAARDGRGAGVRIGAGPRERGRRGVRQLGIPAQGERGLSAAGQGRGAAQGWRGRGGCGGGGGVGVSASGMKSPTFTLGAPLATGAGGGLEQWGALQSYASVPGVTSL